MNQPQNFGVLFENLNVKQEINDLSPLKDKNIIGINFVEIEKDVKKKKKNLLKKVEINFEANKDNDYHYTKNVYDKIKEQGFNPTNF